MLEDDIRKFSKIIKRKELFIGFIFFITWILLLLQHLCIGMYFDDYGNAALAYAYRVENVEGTNYTIFNILEWAHAIYFNWGGRILYASALLIPLLKNGISLYMAIQSIVVTIILFLMYKLSCSYTGKRNSIGIAITVIMSYGLIDRDIHVNGTYWASASILYIWPVIPFLLCVLIYEKICTNIYLGVKTKKIIYIIQIFCITLTTLSQEQYGISLIIYYIIYILLNHINKLKKYLKNDLLCVFWSFITYLFMFCAPGNFVRLESNEKFSNLSVFGKVKYNLPIILDVYLDNSFFIFNLLVIIATSLMIIQLFRKSNKNFWLNLLCISTGLINIFMIIFKNIEGYDNIKRLICLMYFIITALICFVYFAIRDKKEFFAIVVMAACSTYCLLMSPSVVERSFIFYIFCVSIVFSAVFWEFIYELDIRNKRSYLIVVVLVSILCSFGIKAFFNVKTIYLGYYENKYYVEYNDKKLREQDIPESKEIELLIYPNNVYRSLMPCDKGFEFIEYWMKEYYNIPQEIKFKWIKSK